MTTRTVIAALGLAILLGGIAWLIMAGGGSGPPAAALGVGDLIADVATFDAKLVRVEHPDGRIDEARRDSVNSPWMLTVKTPNGPEDPPAWALQPTRMTQFLRLVQSTAARALPEAGSSIGENPVVLELPAKQAPEQGEPGIIRIRFGSKRLGGNVLAEVMDPARGQEPYLAVISDDLLDWVNAPGMPAWRDAAAMPDVSHQARSVTLSRGDRRFTVARTGGRWRVTAPFGAPANEERIPAMLRALESVAVTNFMDGRQPTMAEAGLADPLATVYVQAERPDGDLERKLTIGSPVPGEPGQTFALIGDIPHIVRINAAPLETLPGEAVALVNPPATAVPSKEIFNIALKRLDASGPDMVFRKEGTRWAEVNTAGEAMALDDVAAPQIGELIQFLTTVHPEAIRREPPEGYMPLGTVTLGSLGAAPLDEVTIGVLPTDDSVSVVLHSGAPATAGAGESGGAGGGLQRIYAEGRTPLLIRHFLSGAAFEPIEAPAPSSDPSAK